MQVLMWDPQSSVRLAYTDAKGQSAEWQIGTAQDLWPSLANLGRELQSNHYTTDLTQSYVTNIRIKGNTSPLYIPTTESVLWPAQRAAAKNYSKLLHEGAVIMNPYSIGGAEVTRSFSLGSNTPKPSDVVGAQVGWLLSFDAIAAKMPGLTMPPVLTLGSKTLKPSGCRAVLTWRWVTIPDQQLYVSPLVTLPNELPKVVPDSALVTSVAADAANGTLDLLTELIELPETMKFIGKLVSDACVLTADLEEEARVQRKKMPISKFTSWFSDHWLKGRYALLPIFYTIMDVQAVLAQMETEYAEYKSKSEIDTPFPFGLPNGTICEDVAVTHRCYIRSRYTPDSLMSSFRRLLNVNLASSLWELQTLSFVADWAFNIGDYISALTGSDGASETKCSYSVRNQVEYEIFYDTTDPVLRSLATTVKFNTYQRIIIDPSDHIGLAFDVQMNWKRSVDSFALFANPGIRRLERLLRA